MLASDFTSSLACSLFLILDRFGFWTITAGTAVGVGGTDTVESGVATRGTCIDAALRGGVNCEGEPTDGTLVGAPDFDTAGSSLAAETDAVTGAAAASWSGMGLGAG